MHVHHEIVEYMAAEEQDYKKIVEEYEEEIFVPEEFQEPPVTDATDLAPAQGKPQVITRIFGNHYICMCCAFTLQEFYGSHMHRHTYLRVLLVQVRVMAMLRLIDSVGNLSLLTIGDYYYHDSHNKMVERKW
jgi:hypothetical protein